MFMKMFKKSKIESVLVKGTSTGGFKLHLVINGEPWVYPDNPSNELTFDEAYDCANLSVFVFGVPPKKVNFDLKSLMESPDHSIVLDTIRNNIMTKLTKNIS